MLIVKRLLCAVSHLPRAHHVSPGTTGSTVMEMLGGMALPPGTTVVVYCSVGQRSRELATAMLRHPLEERAAAHVASLHDLQGGIFQWGNDGRSMVDEAGAPTKLVRRRFKKKKNTKKNNTTPSRVGR